MKSLSENTRSLRELYGSISVPIVETTPDFSIGYMNPAAKNLFGTGWMESADTSLRRLIIGRSYVKFTLWSKGDEMMPQEVVLRCIGYPKRFVAYKFFGLDENQGYAFLFVPVSQIQSIEDNFNVYRMAFEHSMNAIYITDPDSNEILAVNPRCTNLFGYSYEEMIGKSDSLFYTDDSQNKILEMKKELREEKDFASRRLECRNSEHDDTAGPKYVETNIFAVENSEPEGSRLIHFVQNVSDQVYLYNELKKAADIDPITGLNNRASFSREYKKIFEEARRTGEKLCVFYIDLDHFKFVNDQYGHNYGDILLKYMAQRIHGCFKRSDFVARIGGDEFAVLLTGGFEESTLTMLAMKLIQGLARPYQLDDIKHTCTCSVGIARYPDDALEASKLLKAADSAMYCAKRNGRNNLSFYDPEQEKQARKNALMRNTLASALDHGRLKLYYQPIHQIVSGKVCGFEALARCFDEAGNMSLPRSFLPIIEQTSLMKSLGLETARQAWQQAIFLYRQGMRLSISVNFSAYQLCSEPLIEFLIAKADKNQKVVPQMKIEITEVLMFEENRTVIRNIHRLMKRGYLFVLDDFGTGHASINSLRKFEFDSIKVDKSFVGDIGNESSNNETLLNAIVSLADSLHLSVVCEGVENQRQIDYLMKLKCAQGQGFFYSEAMNKSQIPAYLRQNDVCQSY